MFVINVLTLLFAVAATLIALNAARLASGAVEEMGYRHNRYRKAAKALAAQRDRRQRQRVRHV